jgi:hypothetical protein
LIGNPAASGRGIKKILIKKAQIDPRRGYWKWASVIILLVIVGAAGISQIGRDILVQTVGSIPEMLEKIESFLPNEEKELLESTVQNETEALGVAQAKEIISPVRTEETKIISLVESWRSAWESKSLNEYIACYHPGFQNKGKDLNAWKHYKEKLNDRYRYISVNVWELKVKVEGRMGWAYFRQRYRSDSLLSYGYKLIEFRKEGDS